MMEIDPRLRDASLGQGGPSQSYNGRPPPSYALNPIRLPPPQPAPPPPPPQHLNHNNNPELPPLAQDGGHPYYSLRLDLPPAQPPSSELHNLHDEPVAPQPRRNTGDGPNDPKRPRACEACRGLKVRCEPDPVKGTCRRCAKAGRQCIVTVPSRKRQKKTDSRVAELEKKIDALTASLHATKGQSASESDDESAAGEGNSGLTMSPNYSRNNGPSRETPRQNNGTLEWLPNPEQYSGPSDGTRKHSSAYSTSPVAGRKRRISEFQTETEFSTPFDPRAVAGNERPAYVPLEPDAKPSNLHPLLMPESRKATTSSAPPHNQEIPGHEYADVVDRKILDASTAAEIFSHYAQNMAKHMPVVVIPHGIKAGEIRRTKPTLFLAILSVASGQVHPNLQPTLTREILRVYAESIICKSEKSLELVQALQVSALWYWPETEGDQKCYLLVHMAAIMAIEIGMSKRPRALKERSYMVLKEYSRSKPHVTDSMESKRAFLSAYFLSATAAMGMRRPTLVRWSPYMDEWLDALESGQDALESDKTLCQWVRLQRLADELGSKLSLDQVCQLDVSDPKIECALKGFERQLNDWHEQTPEAKLSPHLTLGLHTVNLFMYEAAIHFDQSVDDLKTPRTRQGDHDGDANWSEPLTTPHFKALTTCLASIHGILTTFSSFSTEDVRTLPVFYYKRLAYAALCLIKMYLIASTPGSELSRAISVEEMKVTQHLDSALNALRAAADGGKARTAKSFLMVLGMLKNWYERQREGKSSSSEENAKSFKLEAQPVDAGRNTPRLGYRKVSLNVDNYGDRASLERTPHHKPQQHQQQPQHHHHHQPQPQQQQQQPQHHHHQQQQQQPPNPHLSAPPPLTNTPLHLLSEVAMTDQASTAQPTNNNVWYNSYNPTPTPLAYPSSSYYPLDSGGLQGMDPGLEQALGMMFGDGDLSAMFTDDGFLGAGSAPGGYEHMG